MRKRRNSTTYPGELPFLSGTWVRVFGDMHQIDAIAKAGGLPWHGDVLVARRGASVRGSTAKTTIYQIDLSAGEVERLRGKGLLRPSAHGGAGYAWAHHESEAEYFQRTGRFRPTPKQTKQNPRGDDSDRDTREHVYKDGRIEVVFGRNEGREFIVARFPGSKMYRTRAGADRAIAAWKRPRPNRSRTRRKHNPGEPAFRHAGVREAHRLAVRERDAARQRFVEAREGTKKWRDAEEDLNFWQGKVAALERMTR